MNKVRKLLYSIIILLIECGTLSAQINPTYNNGNDYNNNYNSNNSFGNTTINTSQNGQQQTKKREKMQPQNLIRGLKGIDSVSLGRVTLATLVIPGYGQAYNRDYWKIPVIYGTMGTLIFAGSRYNSKLSDIKRVINLANNSTFPQSQIDYYKKQHNYDTYKRNRDLCYIGAGLIWLGGAIDAVARYNHKYHNYIPQRATTFSALLPGLGQAYNGDYWKIPVIYGGFACFYYWFDYCDTQYKRYKKAYTLTYNGKVDEFNNRHSVKSLKSARDLYRRNRDLTVVVAGLWYALNIVDANVSAFMKDFDVSEDLSLKISPSLNINSTYTNEINPSVGVKVTMKFNK